VKNRKNKRKTTRENIGIIILLLKLFRVFKISLTIFIVVFSASFFFLLYKNNVLKNFLIESKLLYSKILYDSTCANVEINGVDKSSIYEMQKKVYNFCNLDNKSNLNILLNQLKQDSWIKDITIKRILPNTLNITIEEYLPFAIWKYGEQIELIDEQGKVINISKRERVGYYNLLLVTGDGSKENIYSLFNMLSSNPNLFTRIKSALRISDRRWNFELDNGIIVKMPEIDLLDAWDKLDKILSIKGSEIDLKIIDLRNKDKVFLEEK
jgi:cell division protein FtsQ